MKKNVLAVMAVVVIVMMSLASFGFASDKNKNYNKNEMEQGQRQGQTAVSGVIYAPQSNGNTAIGSMPYAETHGIGTAGFPMNEYGHHANQMPISRSVTVLREISKDNFATFERITEKMSGKKALKKIRDQIIPRPVIIRTFPETEKIYFVNDLPRGSEVTSIGILTYDSEKDKKYPVLPQELQMFCARDAMNLGANIAIPMDQFFRAHFVPEGMELSLSGIFSWLGLGGNPTGAAVSPHGGIAKQQNRMVGDAGLSFALLRAENPEELLRKPPKPEEKPVIDSCDKILGEIEREEGIFCPNLNRENMERNLRIANLCIEMYVCTGDKTFLGQSYEIETTGKKYDGAIGHFRRAEKSFLHLSSVERESVKTQMAGVYYNWSGCIYILQGEEVAMKFAAEKRLKKICTGFVK